MRVRFFRTKVIPDDPLNSRQPRMSSWPATVTTPTPHAILGYLSLDLCGRSSIGPRVLEKLGEEGGWSYGGNISFLDCDGKVVHISDLFSEDRSEEDGFPLPRISMGVSDFRDLVLDFIEFASSDNDDFEKEYRTA